MFQGSVGIFLECDEITPNNFRFVETCHIIICEDTLDVADMAHT